MIEAVESDCDKGRIQFSTVYEAINLWGLDFRDFCPMNIDLNLFWINCPFYCNLVCMLYCIMKLELSPVTGAPEYRLSIVEFIAYTV